MKCEQCEQALDSEWRHCPRCGTEAVGKAANLPPAIGLWRVATQGPVGATERARDLGLHFGHFLDVVHRLSGEAEVTLVIKSDGELRLPMNQVTVQLEGDYVTSSNVQAVVEAFLGERQSEAVLKKAACERGVTINFLGRDRGRAPDTERRVTALKRKIDHLQRPLTDAEKAERLARKKGKEAA